MKQIMYELFLLAFQTLLQKNILLKIYFILFPLGILAMNLIYDWLIFLIYK